MAIDFTATDHVHMARALRLAERGLYTTQPNPRVGCVIAHAETIIGEGWHQRAGEPHAEVFALREAGARARGATAYVTLEPCAHFGRTPPCADALIATGVARVVAASDDPNPQVAGEGLRRLLGAGIAVETGLMREAARELNRGFFSRIERGRPWVRVKMAMSLDGRTALANGASKWITGEAARADVQRWRARSSAILTGSATVFADNPRLTVRNLEPLCHLEKSEARLEPLSPRERDWGEGPAESIREGDPRPSPGSDRPAASPSRVAHGALQRTMQARPARPAGHPLPMGEGQSHVPPLRVVLDRELRTPLDAHVLDGSAPTLVLHGEDARQNVDRFARVELASVPLRDGRLDLAAAFGLLAERGVNELQVEAGPMLCGALYAAGLVDELLLYVAPVLLGDQARPLLALPGIDAMAAARRLRVIDRRTVGGDQRLLLRG
jgi:diaminohydroxyphosphoribosylaminopyrimidine deaminase / 5-amino-6-(5-phosphoribosylamino)uracil reductase